MGRCLALRTPPLLGSLTLILLLSSSLATAGARTSPATGRIRLLYIGDPWDFAENRVVLGWFRAEPRLEITVVPADLEVMTLSDSVRFTRLYLPRNFHTLNASYDVIIPNNISPRVIETKVLEFFQRGVEDEGIGAYFVGFDYWGGTNDIGFWQAMSFYDILPCDIDTSTYQYPTDGKIYWEVIQRDPLFALPAGLEGVVMFDNRGGDIIPRPGSVVHAVWKQRGTPALVTGTYNRGVTLQLDQAWNDFDLYYMREFRYFPDLVYNHVYFVAEVDAPSDVEFAHRTRELFIDVQARRTVTLSLLDFVEIFGANTKAIEDEIARLDDDRREAERSYIDGEYTSASETLKGILSEYGVLEDQLARVKGNALLWIYLSEWIVVTGASLICGFGLWTLMVRRRLYREVGITRFEK